MRARAVSVSLVAAAMAFTAAGAAADEIAQRKVAMDDVGEALKVMVAMMKNEQPFNGEEVMKAGYTVLNNLSASESLFPEGSTSDNSRAKPEIWQDLERFIGSLDKSKEVARQVAGTGAANDEAAFRRAFVQLGETCKACHQDFRKPRNAS